MFRELIPALADAYHLVAPDYPGFGNSSMPAVDKFDYTFDNLANVVAQKKDYDEAERLHRKALEIRRAVDGSFVGPQGIFGEPVTDIAYVLISQFTSRTRDELVPFLDAMRSAGIDDLIIDLRGNPGGLLTATVNTTHQPMPLRTAPR